MNKASEYIKVLIVLILSLLNYDVKFLFLVLVLYLLYAYLNRPKFSIKEIVIYIFLQCILLAFTYKFIELDYNLLPEELSRFNSSVYFKFNILILIFIILGNLIKYSHIDIRTIRIVLSINVCLVLIQISIYVLSGYYLDYHLFLNGYESRYNSISMLNNIVRFTGLYEEPSTLGAVLLVLSSVILKINNWKLDKLIISSLALSIFTMSTAVIIVSILLVIAIILFNGYKKIGYSIFITLGLFFSSILFSSQITSQYEKFESRIGMRTDLVDFVEMREGYVKYFGLGPYGIEPEIFHSTKSDLVIGRSASINDAGSLVFMVIQFGYLGILIFLLIILNINGWREKLIFIVISLLKISIFHPIYLLLMIFYFEKTNEKTHCPYSSDS